MVIDIQRVSFTLLMMAPRALSTLLRRKRRAPHPRCNGEEGQALIFVAMLMTVLLLFTGLVIDYGRAAVRHRDAQNAADAAALDAAYQIYAGQNEDTAIKQAQIIVTKHGFLTANLATPIFFDADGHQTNIPSAVKSVNAVVTDTVPTLLMQLVGLSSTTVAAAASAVVSASGSGPCAICVMALHATDALNQMGHPTTTVTGGAVVVRSDAPEAALLQGSTQVIADSVGIVGNYRTQGGTSSFSPTPVTGITPILDPLVGIPVPTCQSGNQYTNTTPPGGYLGSGTTSGTIGPGTYSSISIGNNDKLTLSPGVYCITGSLSAGGTAQFNGSGVMLYFTCGTYLSPTACTAGQTGGGFQMTGTPNYNITAPTSGPYQGLSIFYDSKNAATLGLTGDAGDSLTGTIYAISAAMNFVGNVQMSQMDSRIVVGTLYLQGNANITDSYTYSANYQTGVLPALSE